MYSQYPELLVRRGLLHRDATTSSVLCCAPSMLTCESKWHRSCAFGLKGSELGCQPAHTHHTALRLLSTASGCAQQIYGVQPSPGTQQKLMDSTFLKHLAAAATVLSPTTSTCWCQPQEPHALDAQGLSHHKTLGTTHLIGHVSQTTPQVSQERHRLYRKALKSHCKAFRNTRFQGRVHRTTVHNQTNTGN